MPARPSPGSAPDRVAGGPPRADLTSHPSKEALIAIAAIVVADALASDGDGDPGLAAVRRADRRDGGFNCPDVAGFGCPVHQCAGWRCILRSWPWRPSRWQHSFAPLVPAASLSRAHPPPTDRIPPPDRLGGFGIGKLGGRSGLGRDSGCIRVAGRRCCAASGTVTPLMGCSTHRPPHALSEGGGHCEECIFAPVRKRRAKAWASISVTGAKLADNSELTRWRHVF